jgi:MFS transporter, DHA3 family, macrolide efflux protein
VKNQRAVSLLLSANFISGLAQGMSMIAVPMHFAKSGETEWFALAYTLITVVTLFWAPYAGVLADKYPRKSVFVVLMSIMGVSMSLIAGLTYGFGPQNIWVFAAFGLTFWNYSLHYVCLYAIMQEMTEPSQYKKIASILEVQGQLASALAGAGAALILDPKIASWIGIEVWQLHHVFTLDAFTYFAGLLMLLFISYEPISERRPEIGSIMQRLSAGWSYLKKEQYVLVFGIFSQAVFVTVLLHVFELSPAYVKNCLMPDSGMESSIFAISELFYSLGAVVAGLAIQMLFRRTSALWAIVILSFITLLEYSLLISFSSVIIFWIMSFLLGITNAGIRVIRVSYLFKIIPNQFAGRANSIFGLSNTLFRIMLLALFSLPFFHEGRGIIYTFVVMNLFLLLCIGILIALAAKKQQLETRN